jgi:hypothetical protein
MEQGSGLSPATENPIESGQLRRWRALPVEESHFIVLEPELWVSDLGSRILGWRILPAWGSETEWHLTSDILAESEPVQ